MDSADRKGMALVYRVCAVQGGIAIAGAALAGLLSGAPGAAAALFGGAAAVMPTLYFGWRVRLRRPGATPAETVGVFYRGEFAKLALTTLMFVIGAKWLGAQFLPLMLTFSVGLLASYGVALAARW
jgi:ATP synthase protein I